MITKADLLLELSQLEQQSGSEEKGNVLCQWVQNEDWKKASHALAYAAQSNRLVHRFENAEPILPSGIMPPV